MAEVGQVERPQRLPLRHREFEHDKPRTRSEDARRFPEPGIKIHQVAYPESHCRPREDGIVEREAERVGGGWLHPGRLARAPHQHRGHEVGPDHLALEPGTVAQLRCEIERPGAEIEVAIGRRVLPVEPIDGNAPPAPVGVERQEVVQLVIAGGDIAKHRPDIFPLGVAPGDG